VPTARFRGVLAERVGARTIAVDGVSVATALTNMLSEYPHIREHIVDRSDRLLPHVLLIIDGVQTSDRTLLNHSIEKNSELTFLLAVGGG